MTKKILYVEDELEVRLIVAEDLRSHYEVLEAGTYEAALKIIREEHTLDVLVTDFNLHRPEAQNGLDVATAFQSKFPSAPIILATGSILSAPQQNNADRLKIRICEKPFKHSALKEMIESDD